MLTNSSERSVKSMQKSTKKLFIVASCLLMGVFMATGLVQPNRQMVNAANDFSVDYSQNDWGSGATVSVTITNNGSSSINGWTLGWTFPGNQKITNMWNASYTQSGASVTATNQSYNSTIPANGGKVSFGFNLSYSGSNVKPASFTLNGGSVSTPEPTPTPTVTTTPTPTNIIPTPTPTAGPTASSGLPVPPGSGNVPRPSGSQGGLSVLKWAGFSSAGTFTMDDNNSSQVSNLSQILNTGVRHTFYIVSNWSNARSFQAAKNAGCEIGNHTATHPQSGSASDIDTCTNYIQSTYGTKPLTFATPYGNYSGYSSYLPSRFLLARGVNGGTISATSGDPYNLNCNIPSQGASASAMASYFSQARSAGGWCILLIHGFTGDGNAYQPVDVSQYISCINTVKGYSDMWLDTLLNIGAYWRAQQMSITSSQSGSDIIYRWTLPANFPSGKYLRIKLTGGTPMQNGQVINWDGHGYYEIALDEGTLTVSP
jgi:hypothetical protein